MDDWRRNGVAVDQQQDRISQQVFVGGVWCVWWWCAVRGGGCAVGGVVFDG